MLDQVRGYPLGRGLPRHLYYVRGHLDGEKKKKRISAMRVQIASGKLDDIP